MNATNEKPASAEIDTKAWVDDYNARYNSEANQKLLRLCELLGEVEEIADGWTDSHGPGCDCVFCANIHKGDPHILQGVYDSVLLASLAARKVLSDADILSETLEPLDEFLARGERLFGKATTSAPAHVVDGGRAS